MEETKVPVQVENSVPRSLSKGDNLWREMSQKAWFKILYFMMMGLTAWNFWQHGIQEVIANINVDFDIYCRWSKHIQSGYLFLLNVRDIQHPCFYYPPFWGLLISPLTWISYDTARFIWFGMNLLWLVFFIVLIWKWDRKENRNHDFWYRSVIILLLLNFTPLYESLRHGQANVFILFLLTIVLWAYKEKEYVVAGVILGLAVMIKILPIILLGYWFWKKQWKMAIAGFATVVLLGIATLLVTGVSAYHNFFKDNQIYYQYTLTHWGYQSNASLFSLLREAQAHGIVSSHISIYAVTLVFSLLLGLYLMWRIPFREISFVRTGLEYCWILVSLFLMIIYTEHQQYLLLFLVYAFAWIYRDKLKNKLALALLFISWLLIMIGYNLNDFTVQSRIGFLSEYVHTYGVILVWLSLLLLIGIKRDKKIAH